MDYKEKVIALLNNQELSKEQKEKLENIFPELKESEDERMFREIKRYIKEQGDKPTGLPNGTVAISDMIAWLEKQGENKPTDKVEPKFKVGDWIVRGDTIAQILDVQKQYYVGLDINGKDFTLSKFLNDDKIHLWTIEDAKKGDVLVHNGCPFIFMGIKDGIVQALEENLWEGTNPVNFGEPKIDKDYQPSIKEQQELLFQKIKDTGYEWDADKKELKKIEPKKLNADEVIAWLVGNICDYEFYVKLFKIDFGL